MEDLELYGFVGATTSDTGDSDAQEARAQCEPAHRATSTCLFRVLVLASASPYTKKGRFLRSVRQVPLKLR